MSEQTNIIPIDLLRYFAPMELLSAKHLEEVSKKALVSNYGAKKMIFKRGNIEDYAYFLLQGEVDLVDENFNITHLKADSDQTRTTLDGQCPFSVSCVSTTNTKILKVNRDHLDLVLTWSQAGDYLVEELSEEDEQLDAQDWMSLLLQSNLMHKVPPSHIQQLFSAFTAQQVETGKVIIQQGTPGENFYVLETGTAKVTRKDASGQDGLLAHLNKGDFFGEEALVSDCERNATITMTSPGTLMVLDKDSFKRLLKDPVLDYISQDELRAAHSSKQDLKVLDIRSESEYREHSDIPTINLPFSTLRKKISELAENTTYVVHYNGGRRSELAAYLLNEAGLNALILKEHTKTS